MEISEWPEDFLRQIFLCFDQFLCLNRMIKMLMGEVGSSRDTQVVPTAKHIKLWIDKMPVNSQEKLYLQIQKWSCSTVLYVGKMVGGVLYAI